MTKLRTLVFDSRDATPRVVVLKVATESVDPIVTWYGGYHAGDDYRVTLDGEKLPLDLDGRWVQPKRSGSNVMPFFLNEDNTASYYDWNDPMGQHLIDSMAPYDERLAALCFFCGVQATVFARPIQSVPPATPGGKPFAKYDLTMVNGNLHHLGLSCGDLA